MTISPYEEAILCRESSRLKDEAMQRLDGETVAIGFTPGRKSRRKARRNTASTESVSPAEATAMPNANPRAPRRSDA